MDDSYGHMSSLGLYTTNQNGEIRVPVVGTVVVEETKTLPGFTIDPGTKRQVVTVNPADTQTLTVYNAPLFHYSGQRDHHVDRDQRPL